MFFETLESRSLFSVSLVAGVLTVNGTNLSDTITITKNAAGQVSVNDGSVHNFAWAAVNKILVNGLNGGDRITSQDAMTKPMEVHGNDGDDFILGGGGHDSIYGDNDLDTVQGGGGNNDLHGGDGFDEIDYSNRTNKLSITLDDVANDGAVGGGKDNVHSDFEVVEGGKSADQIVAATNTKLIDGNGDNDSLYGAASNATLWGGDGNDLLYSGTGPGTNTLEGDKGDDTLYGNGPFNAMHGGPGKDYINSYSSGTNWEYGEDGDDRLNGGYGQNYLYGGPGNDQIHSEQGKVANHLFGDAGNDDITAGFSNFNEVHGGDGNDILRGGAGKSTLAGDAGDDRIYGGGSLTTLLGGVGNDSLFGGPAIDELHGDSGDDTLITIGGTQFDVLFGGINYDTFWCDAEPTEVIGDLELPESVFGTVHLVSSFSNGINREHYGQNIADPIDAGATKNYYGKPLFASDGPKAEDIRQGQVGDCYFLAALLGTAKIDPDSLRQSVVDLGDGTFAVRFFRVGNPVYVRVDADLTTAGTDLTFAKLGHQNSLWVPIIEKAFTYFRKAQNSYASIANGWADEAFATIGNHGITSRWSWSSAWDLFGSINDDLIGGKAVLVATKLTITPGCPCIDNHMYVVDHVNYEFIRLGDLYLATPISIVLRNPWGYDGAGTDSNYLDGYVTVSAADAMNNFRAVQSAYV